MNVTGTPYEMGYAVGKLMKSEILANIVSFESYISNNIEAILEMVYVPKFLAKIFGNYAVDMFNGLIDLDAIVTLPYTPSRYTDEMKGMADASEIEFKRIRNLNLVQEVLQSAGASSILGAWG